MAKLEKSSKKAPKVHPELDGFELTIDSFGQIVSSLDRDKINQFLDKHLPEDKKLKNRSDEN
ncbi:MAG: hypothetical protein RJA76_1557 [Bacteroidota bacterium]|jgi:hypothetical protein